MTLTRRVLRWTGRLLLGLLALVGVLLFGTLGLFGYLQIQSRQPVTLPAPTGPDQVGRTLYDWTDTSQADPFSPGGRVPREVAVWAWYPASVPEGARRAAYLPPTWQQAVQGDDFLHTRADAVTTHSWQDVPVAGPSPHPVLLFLPGAGRNVADYTTLAEDLASHGYAVFGVDPTYVSDDVILGQDRVVSANQQVNRQMEADSNRDAMGARVIEDEANDLRFALTQVHALAQTPGQRFQGRLDIAHVAFFGHSIGGAGAARACQMEPRCAAAVNIDGIMYGPVVSEGVGKPFLFLGEDPANSGLPTATLRGALQGVPSGQGGALTVTGTGHMNFSDMGVLYRFPPNALGLIGSIDGARALTITRTCLTSFFAAHLLHQPDTLLQGHGSAYPEVRPARGVG